MDPKVLDYLSQERMSVLATAFADGSPHTAAMHFVYKDKALYFSTHFGNRKLDGLNAGHTQASVCIGFSETDWTTLQMDGHIEKPDPVSTKSLILSKYPESEKYMDPSTVFLKFTPRWYRYTDFKVTPPAIIESDVHST